MYKVVTKLLDLDRWRELREHVRKLGWLGLMRVRAMVGSRLAA